MHTGRWEEKNVSLTCLGSAETIVGLLFRGVPRTAPIRLPAVNAAVLVDAI